MKKVNWIIDKNIFEDYEDKLATAILNSGSNLLFYDDSNGTTIFQFLTKNKLSELDIVFFHGSLQHGRRLSKLPYYPGIYLTLYNYECYKYYGKFGEHLLNSNYMMMGLNDVLRNKNKIFGRFGTESIFIRPSDGFKSFPGQTLPFDNFEQEFDILTKSYGGLETDILCVVSPAKDIVEEYRFIVIDGKVVSGSLYMDRNNRKEWKAYYDKVCEDQNAFDFAVEMSKIYQPDKAYTIDVCKLQNGEYKMIELNSFCCASMYGNDYDKVVSAVNELCINDFNDMLI
jgi:hypothetical protein